MSLKRDPLYTRDSRYTKRLLYMYMDSRETFVHTFMDTKISLESQKRHKRPSLHNRLLCMYSLLHEECHLIKSSNLKFVSHMSQFVRHMSQPIACGVSFNQILQSQVRESYVTVRESYVTAYCMWSVIQSNPPISSS